MEISEAFENAISSSPLASEEQKKFLAILEKINQQEQILLLQLFIKFPEKIVPFWEMTKKKLDYIKNGKGNMEKILKEEIEIFS